MAEPLLCWCCARWGLTTEAFDGRERVCLPCLNSTRSDCNTRHLAQALAAAS